jgi:cytochrome c-type biogenesis protein CcmH
MLTFLCAAALLVLITLLVLLRPWQRHVAGLTALASADTAREVNTRVYQHQLQELDRDLAAGTLAPADHAQARADLQRRLLEDAGLGVWAAEEIEAKRVQARAQFALDLRRVPVGTKRKDGAKWDSPAPVAADFVLPPTLLAVQNASNLAPAITQKWRADRSRLALALAVPVLAALLYAQLGAPQALNPTADPATAATQAKVETMVADLAARLNQKPDDPAGWAVLARSYRLMGRLPEAQNAFARIGPQLQQNPTLLAEYADVLAASAQGNLQGEPSRLVQRALQLAPDHPMALALAATAAFSRQDMPQAVTHWERLLKQLPPDSEDARWITAQLLQARSSVAPNAEAATALTQTSPVAPPAPPEAIRGQVSLAPELAAQTSPTDTVFVFARATQGERIPLAVQRARVADLPLSFQLDDSLAMSPAFKLSGATEVRVEARISKTGNATPSAGDLISAGSMTKPGARQMLIQINQTRGGGN